MAPEIKQGEQFQNLPPYLPEGIELTPKDIERARIGRSDVNRVTRVADNKAWTYSGKTDYVVDLTGPGTPLEDFKLGEENLPDSFWMGGMDKKRLKISAIAVRENTIAALSSLGITVDKVSPQQIKEHGPLLLYTGVEVQQKDMDRFKAQEEEIFDTGVPTSQIAQLRDVYDEESGERVAIRHMGHQILAALEAVYTRSLEGKSIKSSEKPSIAIVTHTEHYNRVGFYLRKAMDLLGLTSSDINIQFMGIKREGDEIEDPETAKVKDEAYARYEVKSLIVNGQRGQLADTSVPFTT